MLKQRIKYLLKHSDFLHKLLSGLIKFYLILCYKTTKWHYQNIDRQSCNELIRSSNKIFVFWHNNLAIAPYLFQNNQNIFALVSSHNDGKIIANIIRNFNIGVISGSTNRDAVSALKQILKTLKNQQNIVITPDGPRGPVYKINSNLIAIAKLTNAEIILVAFKISKHFCLNSWDKLVVPQPFNNGKIAIGKFSIYNSKNDEENKLELERQLIQLKNSL